MPATEAFPPLSPSTTPTAGSRLSTPNTTGNGRPSRRRSSGLGGEIRAGDTSAPALATMDVIPSPRSIKAEQARDRKKPTSKRYKARSILRQSKRYAFKHTWVIPLVLLAVIFALYAVNPVPANPVHRFLFLSYALPRDPAAPDAPIQYGKGRWDVAFVSFYIIVLSFTREFIMQKFLRPLARAGGIKSRAKQSRFMEQMYTAIYFGITGPCGLYVMSRTPLWYFNTRAMYEAFPHRTHDASFKFYYLFQAAYWSQQAIVLLLGMEKPRKDFKELVGHHIVSLALIFLSYRFHFTYMGLGVFITHDISDFFLATSKTLNYIDHPLVGPYFAFFVLVWIYLRHYLNLRIIYSEFNEFQTVGPYELDWETEQYKCWISHYISTALLASLQALNLFWLYYILKIAYRYVFFQIAEDERSDNDENEFTEEQRMDEARKGREEGEEEDGEREKDVATANGNGKTSSAQPTRANGKAGRRKA